jgi:hypothetical protein
MSAAVVQRVVARVEMNTGPVVQISLGGADPRREADRRPADSPSTSDERLSLYVRLSARLRDAREIGSARRDFAIGLPARGLGAIWHRHHRTGEPRDGPPEDHHVGPRDIEDAINQMLGRDPEQSRPPRLAWGGLIDALARAGVVVGEQELIAAPLTVELDRTVEAAIGD